MPRVAIIGAGVAGLTAAQELLDRGFEVDIYELKDIAGGKARSFEVPDGEYQATEGRRRLPAEHGFRFFPGFYRHLYESMEKIPFPGKASVAQNLVNVQNLNYARFGKDIVSIPSGKLQGFSDILRLLKDWTGPAGVDMPLSELMRYWRRMLRFFCSCDDRVNEQYERMSWWEFLKAEGTSVYYRRYFGNGSRILVAADPRKACARTNGMVAEQLFIDQSEGLADRVLSGPTNATWLFPWTRELVRHPDCRIFLNARITDIEVDGIHPSVAHLEVTHRDPATATFSQMSDCDLQDGPLLAPVPIPHAGIQADDYIVAVPVEVMASYLYRQDNWTRLALVAPEMQNIVELKTHTQWMNGVVFYLKGDINTVAGHSVYVDTPFALSSIFQEQHWSAHYPLTHYGQGNLTAVCSVIASNWRDTEDNDEQLPNGGFGHIHGASASDTLFSEGCWESGKEKLIDELWQDLKASLTVNKIPVLNDANFEFAYIDPAISIREGKLVNDDALLVNRVDGLRLRPAAVTPVSNLFIAGDYIRTHTDLATMESACEAGKRAVNGVLAKHDLSSQACNIYPLARISRFAAVRFLDRILYRIQKRRGVRHRSSYRL